MTNVIPLGPWQAGALLGDAAATAAEKRWQNARARVALLGKSLYRHAGDDGGTEYRIGLCRFRSLDGVEDALDQIGDDE